MKKNLLMVATVALMAAVSCNKEEVNAPASQEGSKITVEFTAASSPDTKAALVEGDQSTPHKIKWEPNDAIAVNGEVFTTTDNDYTATFKGEVEQSFTAADVYQAVYPAKSGVTVQSFDAIVVPAEQKAVADGFDDIVSVAYSTTTSLQFKHVTSLLRFQVPEFAEKITSVTITSENDLAGTVSVTMDDPGTAPEVTVTTGEKSITLTCEEGFAEDTDYYIAVLPGEKTNLEVRINGYLSKTYATADIPVGGVANMGVLPAPVVRLYIKSEYTHFDMNIYAWGIEEVSLPSSWPGVAMNWDEKKSMYYYDFPYGIKGKELNYIVNNGVYQTPDLDATITTTEHVDDNNVNWHWLYLKPSNNWKEQNPWYAACFDPDGGAYWMKQTGPDENGVYGFVQPPTYTIVEFCRMNPNQTEMNWGNKWNSTKKQTIPTDGNNYFQCTEGWWNEHNDPWTKYTLPEK